MNDYYADYMAELARVSDLRCALAFIEGYSRVVVEDMHPDDAERHIKEIHARAKAALDATERKGE